MAGGLCRLGDVGMGSCTHSSHAPTIPFPYTTIFSMGAVTVNTNGLPSVRLGDIGLSTCGHPTISLIASTTVFAEKLGVHRLSDTGMNFGPYTSILSSVNVNANVNDGG